MSFLWSRGGHPHSCSPPLLPRTCPQGRQRRGLGAVSHIPFPSPPAHCFLSQESWLVIQEEPRDALGQRPQLQLPGPLSSRGTAAGLPSPGAPHCLQPLQTPVAEDPHSQAPGLRDQALREPSTQPWGWGHRGRCQGPAPSRWQGWWCGKPGQGSLPAPASAAPSVQGTAECAAGAPSSPLHMAAPAQVVSPPSGDSHLSRTVPGR